jgi:hypothetical protein
MNTRHEVLDLFRPSRGVIALRPVLMYYAIEIGSIEIGSSLFLSGSFQVLPGMFSDFSGIVQDFSRVSSESPRCGSILSIYSRRTGS